jgi:cis-3-alkyl-4-acyloxetan-2-one decarboxylase
MAQWIMGDMTLRLEPIIDGPANAETVVFVQGWPDDASLWDDVVAAISGRFRCVRVNMPNFDGAVTSAAGHETEEIVEALVDLYRRIGTERPFTLVLHDWGCYWGHAAHHRCPELVSRVAGLDVAPHFKPDLRAAAGIVTYQLWLYGAFKFGGSLGNWMTRRFAKLSHAPRPAEQLDVSMNYPYRNIWADIASGRIEKLTKGYWPTCPLLFVYGEKKPFPFHSQAWVDHVRSVGGEVVALPVGHWVMNDPSFIDVLVRWLQATAS